MGEEEDVNGSQKKKMNSFSVPGIYFTQPTRESEDGDEIGSGFLNYLLGRKYRTRGWDGEWMVDRLLDWLKK
jgi:hypothetical protein